jgi:RNA polymerase primary sigma factor
VESLLAIDRPPRRMEEPLGGEDATAGTLGDLVADPDAEDEYVQVVEQMEIDDLPPLSDSLEKREQKIVSAHYGLGCPSQTLREIAEGLELSVERVRQIEERALGKLREAAASPRAP